MLLNFVWVTEQKGADCRHLWKNLHAVWIMQHPKSELDATVLTTLNLNSYFLVYFMSLHMHEHAADIMWVMNITQHLKSPNLKYSGSQTVVF